MYVGRGTFFGLISCGIQNLTLHCWSWIQLNKLSSSHSAGMTNADLNSSCSLKQLRDLGVQSVGFCRIYSLVKVPHEIAVNETKLLDFHL